MSRLHIDVRDLHHLAADAHRAARTVDTVAVPLGLDEAGRIVAEDARREAAWSTKIPGSISVRRAGPRAIRVQATAQDAAPFEHGGDPGTFYHPVYGHEWTVPQQARPYLQPALDANGPQIERVMLDAVIASMRKGGL